MPLHGNSPAPQVAAPLPYSWPPVGSPSDSGSHADALWMLQHEGQRPNSNGSANTLPFGFLATAVLVSMFLVVAVLERFLRPSSETPDDDERRGDVESQPETDGGKGRCSPPQKASLYECDISVLMPGDDVPSFIAHPAPISRPLEPPPLPSRHQLTIQRQLTTPNSSQPGPGYLGINLINSCYI
ncbi:hypothetical protein MLD38_027525 [Melastoma candidum]|uniref:Uncharacterized protein n=1 Tax=Melastoma candidum TaxID=119954 RepID=A0ACB9P2H9_9MYRT|nr:hypothetical protein MLD38_027525 [Melastoma candidum]